jgi:23S rRNA (uracil1939-C5)-methyltransferase
VGRKKNEPLIIENVRITDIGAEGNAIARIDNMVVFVPMLIPGDVVDIIVKKKRRKYLEGRVIRFREYSGERTVQQCKHFGICGGCKWQHLPYDLQLFYKEKQVRDNLTRIGKVELADIKPVIGSAKTYLYRNKLEYTFSSNRWLTDEEFAGGNEIERGGALGFHIPGFFDKVLDIEWCHLQPEPSNAIRKAVKEYAIKKGYSFFDIREQNGFLRNIVIRNTDDGRFMVIVVFFYDDREKRENILDYLSESFPEINSLQYVINSKKNDSLGDQNPILYKGSDHLIWEMDGLKFRIGAKSFSQTNTDQALKLYRVAASLARLTGTETVYDLYTGIGTIANFIARSASKVMGIEFMEEAVRDAVINSEINGIKNTFFFSGDIRDVLSDQFMSEHGYPDVVITDPPRAGMNEAVINMICRARPSRIVYISCNPATQARDLLLFADNYSVAEVQPVDMFPQTHHVENVVLLERRQVIKRPSAV